MKHIIIGTAGHIDHGKTSLIKALTGRETDTLKEEKDRGISINLGFTFFDLPSGRRAGIIDVPGHEKFVKNMLAGVSGVDLVLLVIAADEGIMPQTREHFEILQLLNVKRGIIVLTKSDMVDSEWLEMVKEEVKEEFKGTFLEKAPIHAVSSKTKEGLGDLIKDIDILTGEIDTKDVGGHFRLPVDRVFSISGFGTVITGTVISGMIEEGQWVEIYPSKVKAKVRGIEVHDSHVKIAEAGQRTAINLSNVKTSDVRRGDVVASEDIMEPSLMVDCSLYYLKSAPKPLENRQRVRLYHGTSEILCRVVIIDKEEVQPGEHAYVQLRLEKPLTAQRNDRFVIRNYSPMFTIGGGAIIEPLAKKAKRFDQDYIEELKIKESGETGSILENTVKNLSGEFPKAADILKALGKNEEGLEEKLDKLAEEGRIIKLSGMDKPVYIHSDFVKKKIEAMQDILDKYHRENPLRWGVSKEEMKNKVFGKALKQKLYDELLLILEERHRIKLHGKFIALYGFEIAYSEQQLQMKESIMKLLGENEFAPPRYTDMEAREKVPKEFKMVFESLLDEGVIVKINEECYLLKEAYEKSKEMTAQYIRDNGSINVAQLRDLLDTSRKYSLAIMEHFDSIKLTKRVGDDRVLF
jgi:selenocysteine-specific elongation factor